MKSRLVRVLTWLIRLFDPPPLSTLSLWQKIGRSIAVSFTLFAVCTLTALAVTSGIFLLDRTYTALCDAPQLLRGLEIVTTSFGVNVICVLVLLEIRKADLKLHLEFSGGQAAHS